MATYFNNGLNSSSPGIVTILATGEPAASTIAQYEIAAGAGNDTIQGISPGTAGQVLTSNGASAFATFQAIGGGGSFTSINMQVKTTSGNYTPSANLSYAVIEVVGGGGNGGSGGSTGGGQSATGGGGGGGGYSRGVFSLADIHADSGWTGTDLPFVVGGAGGTSSVGSDPLIQATGGGTGGSGVAAGAGGAGGAGGVGSLGSFNSNGNTGGDGGSTLAALSIGGASGSSVFGGGAGQQILPGNGIANGTAGSTYGAGGGGSANAGLGNSSTGGAGSAGVIIITEYIA